MPAPAAAAGRDRLVYTPARPGIAAARLAHEEDEPVVYYPAAPAAAAERPRDAGAAGVHTTPTRHTIAAGHKDAPPRPRPSHELGLYQPASHPIEVTDEPPPATARPAVPIHFVAQPQDPDRAHPVGALPRGQDQPRPALPPGRGPLVGRPLQEGERLPADIHEANLTVDKDGNRVFEVYRPQGSRFYAQDE